MKQEYLVKKVIAKRPSARCEWCDVWRRWEVVTDDRLLGSGATKDEAWINAAENLEIQ